MQLSMAKQQLIPLTDSGKNVATILALQQSAREQAPVLLK